jgi:hypothetical protein
MKKFSIVFKRLFVQALLWLALLLAMAASLSHVAYSFNRFETAQHQAVGWLAAVGVDLGLVCLAVGIQRYRQTGRGTGTLWTALLFVTAISVLANVSHGVVVVNGEHLSVTSFANLDWLETTTMLLLAGCLPVLVFALTEVAASDTGTALETIQKETRKLEKRQARQASTTGFESTPETAARARRQRELDADQAADGLWQFVATHPNLMGLTHAEVGGQFGRSRSWVSDKFRTWERQGAVQRGDGLVNVLVADRPNGQD